MSYCGFRGSAFLPESTKPFHFPLKRSLYIRKDIRIIALVLGTNFTCNFCISPILGLLGKKDLTKADLAKVTSSHQSFKSYNVTIDKVVKKVLDYFVEFFPSNTQAGTLSIYRRLSGPSLESFCCSTTLQKAAIFFLTKNLLLLKKC